MTTFWSLWIIVLTSANLGLVLWILLANRKVAVDDTEDPENKTTGHVYDGIEEYDNPLPKWWFYLFIATFIFAVGYLIVYPGFGSFKGVSGWTSIKQLEQEQEQAKETYQDTFGTFANMPVDALLDDSKALKMGARLFADNCSVCHGADAGGNFGFPNLTDNDWLWGGSPEEIKYTLVHGRQAAMPAWGAIIGEDGIADTAEYLLSLSNPAAVTAEPETANKDELVLSAAAVARGEKHFATNCVACHGADAKGMNSMGAPNLTDDIWLYGGSLKQIRQTLRNGRNGVMPSQGDKLRDDKIHLLTAYVYSLSKYDE